MPSKSLGLFLGSLSTNPLFCVEFVEITNKIETAEDKKARKRKGVAVGGKPFRGHCCPPKVGMRDKSHLLTTV